MTKLEFAKLSGTHADVLAAVGAADLMQSIRPRLLDTGTGFEVRFPREATLDDIADGPGFRYLKVAEKTSSEDPANTGKKPKVKRESVPLPESLIFDYTTNQEKHKRQQQAKNSKDRDIAEAMAEDAPDPEFRSYRIMNVLQGDSGPNKLIEEYSRHDRDAWLKLVWLALHGQGKFPCDAPLVQLFNPHSAKGYSLIKATGTDRNDKTKEKWAEPFTEWLKYRGYFSSCAGWFLGSKGEHVRLYCPIPKDISFDLYKDVTSQLRKEPLAGSAPKLDCLSTLRLTKFLLAKSISRPAKSISGLWVAHYQSLGQAKAITSIDRLAVPDWFGDAPQKSLWIETLEEHDTVLRRLNDDISEELALLKAYRRFLQEWDAAALPEFVAFLCAYGNHIFRLRGQGKWLLPQFTARRVEAILIPYKDILENQGFQAVADAIRSATVSAQYAKSKGGDYREIQYGLIPELRRKCSLGKDELMTAISEFLAGFNAESARRNEMKKTGYRVSQAEFAAFAELMDNSTPELVGSLLCAMATCKIGQEEKEDTQNA